MTDFDRRGQRGGFSHGRKRRFREDGDFDRRAQRRRYEEPLHIRLRKQLLGLAESPNRSVEDEIGGATKSAVELFDDEEHKSQVITLTTQLVFEQPPKIPFLASFIMACNSENMELAKSILENVSSSVQTHMQAGAWREVKLGLRLFACLQAILKGDGVFPILEDLFSTAVDLQTTSSDDALGLELVEIILTSIAYLMASPAEGLGERAAALLEKTDIIASTPHALDTLVTPFPGTAEAEERQQPSMIGLLQRSLQAEAAADWPLKCIPRPWKAIVSLKLGDDEIRHGLPDITVPTPAPLGSRLRFPKLYVSVYSGQDVETVPPPDNLTCALVRDVLVDTINVLDFNRHVAAKLLIDVDCFFSPGTFVNRGTPFDKLKEVPEERSKWKPEDVAVDAVFSQLLQLPSPEHKLVYYHSVLTEACKLAPAAIAPSLGRAIRQLYGKLDVMDLELQYRFLDWLSHHLSNFGFTWKWTEWADDVELAPVHVKKAFILGLLEKEIRLSVVQRVQGTLPEAYHRLLPDQKTEDEPPEFKYASDGARFGPEGREILQLIRRKAADTEVQETLDKIQTIAQDSGHANPPLAPVDVFTSCVCFAGSKSLSHLLSYIERCKDRLLAMGTSSEASRQQIISSVMDYWSEKPGTGTNIVDKLLNYSILTPESVIRWALESQPRAGDGGEVLAKSHIFEMVASTTFKVTSRMRQIMIAGQQKDLPDEQAKLLNQTLEQEQTEMQKLFSVLDEQLQALANTSNGANSERPAVVEWGKRWLGVFRRKLQVEDIWREQEVQASRGQDTEMQNGTG